MLRKLGLLLFVLVLFTVSLAQSSAKSPSTDPATLSVVAGPVDLGQGVIMVNNYIIVPSTGLQSPTLQQGDEVVVIGYLQPDGVTVLATSFELFAGTNAPLLESTEEPTPEATVEPTAEVTMEPTPEVTMEPTPEVTMEPTPEVTMEPTAEVTTEPADCIQSGQPVGQRLADDFGVSYDEIMGWFCQGFGFGEIARAYLMADSSGDPAASYFDQRQAGMGWGEIVKEAGVQPSSLAPGQVIRPHSDNPEDQPGNSGNNGNNGDHPNNGNNGDHPNNGNNGNGNSDNGKSNNGRANGHG